MLDISIVLKWLGMRTKDSPMMNIYVIHLSHTCLAWSRGRNPCVAMSANERITRVDMKRTWEMPIYLGSGERKSVRESVENITKKIRFMSLCLRSIGMEISATTMIGPVATRKCSGVKRVCCVASHNFN